MTFLVVMEVSCVVLVVQCGLVFVHPVEGIEKISHKSGIGIASLLFIVAVVAMVAVGRILKIHLKNFMVGRTSSERFSRSSTIGSRMIKYSFRNCWNTCWNID